MIDAKRLWWAGGKAENVNTHLNTSTMVGRDLRARRKREAGWKDHADEGRLIKNSPSSIRQGF